ncbi:MAG TPA: hypothetical protein VMW27_17265 [Thermoanaerobaculia bacterium]|nr:hypothetical protein [Thermoanaerobaculia bacterium]
MSTGAWSTYSLYGLYGLVMASDFPFTSPLAPGTGQPDLTFTCAAAPSISGDLPAPVYVSRFRNTRGESNCLFYRLDGLDLLRFPEVGDFYLYTDRIICHAVDPGAVETYLLGTVLSCWLERAEVPCLHASAVVAGDAVGFLSFNGGGKSSLATAMLQEGCPLLTDDVLAIEPGPEGFCGRFGYPQMRLWPPEADHFWGSAARFQRVHQVSPKVRVPVDSAAFDAAGRSLACLYLPVRRPSVEDDGAVRFEALSARDAVIEFVRHSFVAPLVQAAGWQPRRIDLFAQLAAQVPVRRLIYPSGFEHLPRVIDEIFKDLDRLG